MIFHKNAQSSQHAERLTDFSLMFACTFRSIFVCMCKMFVRSSKVEKNLGFNSRLLIKGEQFVDIK